MSIRYLTVAFLLLSHTSVWALEPVTPLKRFNIAQERYHRNGVHVVRPKQLDLKILNILDLNGIRNLEDYSRWLAKNIKYKRDGLKDVWANPIDTLERRKGDCEDYVLLNLYALKMLGFKPKFFALQKPGEAHAICVFKVKGNFYLFDNTKLIKTSTQSIRDFAKQTLQKTSYVRMFEYNQQTGKWSLLYTQS